MSQEIEKKYSVENDSWINQAYEKIEISQGYLNAEPERTVRVRTAGNKGYITIKGISKGDARDEFEYEIPFSEAKFIIQTMSKGIIIEKERFMVKDQYGFIWSIDKFHGLNEGLIVAEVELSPSQPIFPTQLPNWIGSDISEDKRYCNSNLSKHPFTEWHRKQ